MGALPVGLFVIWAVHNGGYDTDTWYWGALLVLATLGVVLALGVARPRLSKAAIVALCAFALYVAWSYLSIAWAQSPGDALQGSNRALLYLLVFALMLSIPWTVEAAFGLLLVFVLAVGVIAVVLLVRFASMDHVGALVIEGRLSAPTGYFNATAALFTMQALTAIVLSTRRELPFVVRGALLATACAGLELAVAVQSRGWLLTLPLIAIVGIAIVPDRLRVVAAAILPVLGTLFPLRTLLHLYTSANAAELSHTAGTAGKRGLVSCGVVLIVGSLVAWLDQRTHAAALGRGARRAIGATVAVAAVALGFAGAMVATHGHLFHFISRQWNGFSHETTSDTATHFAALGSGRYDFWRVALDAFLAHPVGGLGQDNFADYYILHRHTGEDPAWAHSLEFRLLAHTGAVGFVLFAVFVIAALTAAIQVRRHGRGLAAAVTGAAMLPFIVWLIHGSVDWFWEVPALSGPALGFLAMSGALRETQPATVEEPARPPRWRAARFAAAVAAGVAATVVLGFPYLAVRETSIGSNLSASDPAAALSHLKTASRLNPLEADPGRVAGTIALQNGYFAEAQQIFQQVISREPGGWYGWFGAGLAASSLGDKSAAEHYLRGAQAINSRERAINDTITALNTSQPLTADQALNLIVLDG
jgi:O-Antigen ligase